MNITTTITQKGQVTIPVIIRRLLQLRPFDKLVFSIEEEKIVATPVKGDILELYGSVKKRERVVNLKQLRKKTIKGMATEIAAEGK